MTARALKTGSAKCSADDGATDEDEDEDEDQTGRGRY
jgi:hypothetical protein